MNAELKNQMFFSSSFVVQHSSFSVTHPLAGGTDLHAFTTAARFEMLEASKGVASNIHAATSSSS